MIDPVNNALGIHTRALAVWSQRAEVLASNLANADTPHYFARDIDFRAALSKAQGHTLRLEQTEPQHLQSTLGHQPGGAVKYRVPLQPSVDGNTVDTQTEQAAFAGNTVHYQASLTFLNATIGALRTAITGAV